MTFSNLNLKDDHGNVTSFCKDKQEDYVLSTFLAVLTGVPLNSSLPQPGQTLSDYWCISPFGVPRLHNYKFLHSCTPHEVRYVILIITPYICRLAPIGILERLGETDITKVTKR